MSKFLFIYKDPSSKLNVVGETPHGIYDNDTDFQNDSLTVCKYVAKKLGHPVMQLEFNTGQYMLVLKKQYQNTLNKLITTIQRIGCGNIMVQPRDKVVHWVIWVLTNQKLHIWVQHFYYQNNMVRL